MIKDVNPVRSNASNGVKDKLLLVSVFITGLAVLVIEIVAIRILSPHYGNTIYATSSVIGTVLAALSLGYYIGGVLSDKYPSHRFFYGIIFISGLLTISIQILDNNLLPYLSILSITIGPFISSLLIFFIPAFSLGILSPFAVKLHKKEYDKIGQQSGEVFFWSTLGSIAGSILSGFFLIPYFGIDTIIVGTGIFLSMWGFCGFLFFKPVHKRVVIGMIFLFLFTVFLTWYYIPQKSLAVLYQKDGVYEKIKISDGQWNNHPARFLFQDRSYSAAMYLDSDELAYDYTKYYELYKLVNPKAKSAFVIGGGAYSIPKALLKESPNMQVDVAEIEPELFNLAKNYFNLTDTSRLHNYTEDGRHFLNKNPKKYDIIVSDVYYSFFSIPAHFTTKEFFNLTKNRLNDNGVFIGNFAGNLDQKSPSFILSEIKTFKNVFPNSYFFAVNSLASKVPQNIIFLGVNNEKQLNLGSDAISKNNNPIIRNLPQKNINVHNLTLSQYSEITDNFSPIEYLVSKAVNKWY